MNALLEIKVPSVGESVTEVEVGAWLRQAGETVRKDDSLVVLETDKATLEIPSPVHGRLAQILRQRGERVSVGDVLGVVEPGEAPAATTPAATDSIPTAAPAAAPRVMPAAARVLAEKGLPASAAQPTGPGGRILKEDALRAQAQPAAAAPPPVTPAPATPTPTPATPAPTAPTLPAAATPKPAPPPPTLPPVAATSDRAEEIVPMSLLRRKIAEHLVRAQSEAALLTTFNEIDMSAVLAARKEYQERFLERHQVKLGFMSFFVKAATTALLEVPQVNAELRGTNIIYRRYCDVGVAIGGGKGLVVPVVRHAERLGFAEIELAIADFAKRAKESRLQPEELAGGTFTITNGGIYGSLLSTPIVNPPQSGVLGLHAIQDRPVAVAGQVVIRPMMYVALTYDHRLVDGREAVTFLKRVKELVENPVRMLIAI